MLDKLTGANQGGQLRSYKYDALGRLLFERIPEQTGTISDGSGGMWSTKYSYTEWGAVSIRTDARGVETHYKYDSLHRLIEQWYTGVGGDVAGTVRPALPSGVSATNNVAYSYDTSSMSSTSGLLMSITMTGPLATYTESYTYDSYRRMTAKTWTRDNLSFTAGYGYNQLGQRTSLTYPSGRVVKTNYDSTGRFSSLVNQTENMNFVSNVAYNVSGQVTGMTLGNGVTETYYYDAQRMQLTAQQATAPGGPMAGLMNVGYTYNANAGDNGAGTSAGNTGQVMSVYGQIGGIGEGALYSYDLQGRLATSYTGTNNQSAYRRYGYDRWGNRTAVWDATSGGNQIQSVSLHQENNVPTNQIQSVTTSGVAKTYIYDAAGNVINDGTYAYDYDAENRNNGVNSGATAAVAFDYQNQRIKRVAGGNTTYYVWEGSKVIAEYNGSGSLQCEYIYSGSRMVAKYMSGVLRYYLNDRLSTRLVLNVYGQEIGRQSHLPYGEEIAVAAEQEKHHYTSYERDPETTLDYAINRSYSLAVGRFQSADSYKASAVVNDPQSLNRYSYTRNDPINRTDPLGLVFLPTNPPPTSMGCYIGTHYDFWLGACIRDGLTVDPYRPQPPGVTAGWMITPQPVGFPVTPIDLEKWLKELLSQPGKTSVDPACGNSVLYVPETGAVGDASKDWHDAAGIQDVKTDFIATARGVLKIPNNCSCTVSCSNGDDYKIKCLCNTVFHHIC